MSDDIRGPRLSDHAGTRIVDRDRSFDLSILGNSTCLPDAAALGGRSVLVKTSRQLASALAMVELDGRARRIVLAPPDLTPEHLDSIVTDAEIDLVVSDEPASTSVYKRPVAEIGPLRPRAAERPARAHDTEWVLLTSGTAGRPKMVVHTLAGLCGAIAAAPLEDGARTIWATFYDIRRYGGLQIFLRAVLGGADLVLTHPDEPLPEQLHRLASAGVAAISGTPSHWRRVLMSHERGSFAPRYIRLSGEIADQLVLDGLRSAFPDARIGHAYASTEGGVGFAVDDGLEGFPASLVGSTGGEVQLKVVDGSLRIRSGRTAARYVGAHAPSLFDNDGFVDTGDLVERRHDRFHFVGRHGGIINVGGLKVNPEEVEAALNRHEAVRMSLVRARKNPLTGAIVVADVVLNGRSEESDALKQDILARCQHSLERHKVPAMIRFVPSLALTSGGKLNRAHG